MTLKQFFRELLTAILIGSGIYIVVILINLINGSGAYPELNWKLLLHFLGNQVFAVLIYFANAVVVRILVSRHGRAIFRFQNLVVAAIGSIVATMAAIFLAGFIVDVIFSGKSVEQFIAGEVGANYLFTSVLALLITAAFYTFYYYKHKKDKQVTRQQVIAGAATAQFDALKNQLDPHFLFNSLNVLSSLIEENPEAARKFTTGLSKIYRYVLEQKNKELVSLDEELAFARTYVGLLKMRFESGIAFHIPEKASDPQYKVVPLSLQLLLENAVKHNRVSAEAPLNIEIRESEGYLEVRNNLQPKQVLRKGSGVGLRNIADRYALLTNKQVYKNKDDGEFVVKVPLLSKQVSPMEIQKEYIQDKRYQRAKERVEALKGFYGNLIAFMIVIPALAWLNYKTTSFPWIFFPILGWGFGLLMHGMEAYGYNPLWGKRWEERKIREFMEEDNKNKNLYR